MKTRLKYYVLQLGDPNPNLREVHFHVLAPPDAVDHLHFREAGRQPLPMREGHWWGCSGNGGGQCRASCKGWEQV